MKIVKVTTGKKSDATQTSPEELKKAQGDYNSIRKTLKKAWETQTETNELIMELSSLVAKLPPELALNCYNDFSKVVSQALNTISNIKGIQSRIIK